MILKNFYCPRLKNQSVLILKIYVVVPVTTLRNYKRITKFIITKSIENLLYFQWVIM